VKKAESVLLWLLLIVSLLLPLCSFSSLFIGYSTVFAFYHSPALAIVTALLAALTVILDLVSRNTAESKVISAGLTFLPPLSIFTGAILIARRPQIFVFIAVWVYVVCCYYISVKHGKPLLLKYVLLLLSVMMILPVCCIVFISLLFGNFGEKTVVQTIPSPSGKYYAQVIDDDQGALGGNTLVEVYEKCPVDNFFIQIQKKPQTVYIGEWGESNSMDIYWKNDECLVINSIEYPIEFASTQSRAKTCRASAGFFCIDIFRRFGILYIKERDTYERIREKI